MLNNMEPNRRKKEQIVQLVLAGIILLVGIIICLCNIKDISHRFEINFISQDNYLQLLKGLGNTFLITLVGFIGGLLLGAITCIVLGLESHNVFLLALKQVFKAYVSIFRGTPAVVQLLILYFVVFQSFRGDAIFIAMLAFALNSGAYVSEILRGGINAVSFGQTEAGRSLGLSYSKVMIKIIFPQAIRNALPSLGNEFVTLIKETSVVGFIASFDLSLAFRKVAGSTYDYMFVYLWMGVLYFVIIFGFTKLFSLLERKLLKK